MDDNQNNMHSGGGVSEIISQLQNMARQLSIWSQSISNSTPAATTTTSPKFTGVTVGTTTSTTVFVAASTTRHGMLLRNVGLTTNVYIYQANMTPAPTTSAVQGAIVIYPGGTLSMPSVTFPNCNAGFIGFTLTGSSQPFTVIEFY